MTYTFDDELKKIDQTMKQINCDYIIDNFLNQLQFFDKNMKTYIDSCLKAYLKTDMYVDVRSYCYNNLVKLQLAISGFCNTYEKDKTSEIYRQTLLKAMKMFGDDWFMRKKDKKGNWIDGSSRFHKLIRKREKVIFSDNRKQLST